LSFKRDDSLNLILIVSGVCNGYLNDIIMSNQVINNQRRLLQHHMNQQKQTPVDPFQCLEDEADERATSNCFCPVNAVINIITPSVDVVVESFQQELGEANVDLKVKKIDEVASIACDDVEETTGFTSHVSFAFAASMDVAYSEVQRFAINLAEEYNTLVMAYCDPLIRRNIALEAEDIIQMTPNIQPVNGCVNFEGQLLAVGSCRGCQDGTSLFDDNQSKPARRHCLKQDEECFCDAKTIASRAPTQSELWVRVEQAIVDAELDGIICGRPV
jgi:hypothetical protein